MLLGGMTVLSVLCAAGLCGVCDGFAQMQWLWMIPVFFVGSFLAWILVAFVFLWIMASRVDRSIPQEKDSPFYRKMVGLYADAVLTIGGVRVDARGLEKMPKEGRFLLVCNHLNESDPVILLNYFRKSQLAFISKQENDNMFIVGKVMHKILCQPINRNNDREALRCILRCIQILKDDLASVAVFPEGYIYGDNKLHPFRSGVFKIAQKAKVPIVICTLQGTQHVFHNVKRLKPTKVVLHLVDVIPAEVIADKTAVDIAGEVYERMVADVAPEYRIAPEST